VDLPQSSPLIVFTLERPSFAAALLLLAAALVWFALRYRHPRQTLIATASLIGAAIGLVALAALVETTGERLGRETRLLVEAAVAGDVATVQHLLDDELIVRAGRDRANVGKSDLLERIPALREFVKSNNIRQVQGAGTGRDSGESILVQTTTTYLGAPTPNEWRFRWRRDGQGRWRVREMIWERWGFDDVPTVDLLRR